MGGKKNTRIKYDAYVIIPKNRTTTFSDRLEQQMAYNAIVTNGYCVDMDGIECDKIVTFEDSCLPIRICIDRTGKDIADDWNLGSPIQEIGFDCIIRWWPKKWFMKPNGTLPEKVLLHYGPVDIDLTVINPDEEIVKDSFADTIISQDSQLVQPNNSVTKDMGGEEIMFKKNRIKEEVISENKINTVDEAVIDTTKAEEEDTNMPTSENATEVAATQTQSETTEATPKVKKGFKNSKLGKGVAACAIIATAAGIGFGIWKLISLKKGGAEAAAE